MAGGSWPLTALFEVRIVEGALWWRGVLVLMRAGDGDARREGLSGDGVAGGRRVMLVNSLSDGNDG